MFFIVSFLYHYLTMCLEVGMLDDSYFIGTEGGNPEIGMRRGQGFCGDFCANVLFNLFHIFPPSLQTTFTFGHVQVSMQNVVIRLD